MQYPVIDNLTYAYQRNGWMGLELIEGKNLFNGTYINILGLRDIEGTFINTIADTRSMFQFNVQALLNNQIVRVSSTININRTGRFHVNLNNAPEFDALRIKHNGSTVDMYFTTSVSGSGDYTISLNVIDSDPTIINGLIFNDIQIEKGTEETPYEPYEPPTTDIKDRLKLPMIHYFPHPVIDALQRAAAGTQTADDTEILRHYLTPLGIGGI